MKNTIGLEYKARGYSEEEIEHASNVKGYAADHIDEKTGQAIAFNQRGNWNNSFQRARKYHSKTNCPDHFQLTGGAIYLQEAPDFYCSDVDLAEGMLGLGEQESGKTKIVHLLRNPFDMVLSNYFYHAQDPTVSGFWELIYIVSTGFSISKIMCTLNPSPSNGFMLMILAR